MRRLWLALGFLLVPTLVHADDHRARAYAAMSEGLASILAGFYGSVDITTPMMDRDLGVLVGFSVHSGTHDDVGETNLAFLFGPTVALLPKEDKTFVFSGHLLLGVVSTDSDDDTRDDTKFGLGFGGAWDYRPSRSKSGQESGFGARVQVDWIWGQDEAANFLRASVGATYTWH